MTWSTEMLGPLRYEEMREQLIRMGDAGWEVVSAYVVTGPTGAWHFAVLKRPNKVGVRRYDWTVEG